jgi:hypothetical protein
VLKEKLNQNVFPGAILCLLSNENYVDYTGVWNVVWGASRGVSQHFFFAKEQDRKCTINTVARSRNHFCSGNTTMHSVCIFELYVTINYIKISRIAQQCNYGNLMSPSTVKRRKVL